ncbi:MAG TPA: VWA domain-containing protein [Bryobacteraceae bacterium]|nr:VWA domain-containing protein [Bryobacteraceae bacterium]
MSELLNVEFVNADPRCACALVLDTSGSMGGAPISALNEGLAAFQQELQNDALASRRVEVAIVTFGDHGVRTVQDFVSAAQFTAPMLSSGGMTPMGQAISTALDLVRNRKAVYKANGVPYYRPWVFLITDGGPTDEWGTAAKKVHDEEQANGIAFFAVGTAGADMEVLSQIAVRPPLHLDGLKFVELFVWLSQSQKRVSGSKVGEQTALPPVGWTAV